ncbi:hypothetical protein HYFRA_00009624 [Hymenoscyphus fraxineus]|uniref:1,3-beta-glucanosyltransferase n=1 Tax=Hymenoscyphus fraxineus TaxID=746836 RepID=A0A9N9PQW3_9HELO|nr:hypothetical protein HYFRA_00009624 [Hymenoscyphus fraxineus]
MKTTYASVATAALVLARSVVAADLPPIIMKGSHFFYENGTEFFLKGIAYQQEVGPAGTTTTDGAFLDPLADEPGCTRDVPLLKELGVNVIRVYAINVTLNHDPCMKLLNDAGIYVIQDLSNPKNSIVRTAPKWDINLFATYAGVIDELAGYTNTLGFFAGNEVSNDLTNTDASAFVKAAVRDSKAYIKNKGYRPMGVGYATNDDAAIRDDMTAYFNCGDPSESIDFWGYNIYSWCGDSSFTESGYDKRTEEFRTFNVPSFFAEYGCNTVQPHPFTEVAEIFGPKMTDVFSGGIMYMFHQEANDYGVVTIKDGQAIKHPRFEALKKQMTAVNPKNTPASEYNIVNTKPSDCPTSSTWKASSNLPPIANSEACDCMVASLTCTANSGLTGNQTAELFASVCGMDPKACAGIQANGTTGVYGAYSMCTGSQQLSWAFDQYYKNQNRASTSCSFNGNAKLQTGSVSSSCTALLAEAGSDGLGKVKTPPTSAGQTAGGANGGSTSKAAAGALTVPAFNFGMLSLGAYVVAAGMAGMGMVLL